MFPYIFIINKTNVLLLVCSLHGQTCYADSAENQGKLVTSGEVF